MREDVQKQYNLPGEIRFGKLCTVSNQRSRITFDEEGVRSACNYAKFKRNGIDWDQRERELLVLCDKHRKTNGEYDVIVPCSGGKDGSFVAHQLKYKYGMNPLAVTWAPLNATAIGPITVGGGVRSVEDVQALLDSGADKVAINTAAVHNPTLISKICGRFGAQCTVLSIEAKRQPDGSWQAYTDNGREPTGLDPAEWARRGVELGAGEILLTSVDREGTRKGFDVDLTARVTAAVGVPVVANGGMGKAQDMVSVVSKGGADAVAMADVLHYGRLELDQIRSAAREAGIKVRQHLSV